MSYRKEEAVVLPMNSDIYYNTIIEKKLKLYGYVCVIDELEQGIVSRVLESSSIVKFFTIVKIENCEKVCLVYATREEIYENAIDLAKKLLEHNIRFRIFNEKKRHPLFVMANEMAIRVGFSYEEAWGNADVIKNIADAYRCDVKEKKLIVANMNTGKINKLPYFTRFSEKYAEMQTEKIMRAVRFDSAMFLTLTIDPKKFSSLRNAYVGMRRAWHRLYSSMVLASKRSSKYMNEDIIRNWNGEYFLSVEMQPEKTNAPHLHIVLNCCTWLNADWVRAEWESAGTFIRTDKVINNRGHVVSYLIKYMKKSMSDGNVPKLTPALLWALRARSFSGSKGIFNSGRKINFNKEVSFWVFMGCYYVEICEKWDHLEDIQDYIRAKYADG